MATKRTASEAGASTASGPPAKKITLPPVRICVSTLEEMDMQVLKFQNKKLQERIEQRRKAEEELRKRIEQLEQRQTTDDAVLCIVNRYWNQLDEDARVLLQRFDAEGADESEKKNESPAVTSFLALLSQWDKPEIEEKLRQRVEFSKRAIGKLLQAYDRLLQRNDRLTLAVKGKCSGKAEEDEKKDTDVKEDIKLNIKKEPPSESDTEVKEGEGTEGEESETKPDIKTEVKEESETEVKTEKEEGEETEKKEEKEKEEKVTEVSLSEAVLLELEETKAENQRLHNLSTELHQRHHELTLKNSELLDGLAAAETEAAELKNNVDDLEYNHENASLKVDKLERHLQDCFSKIQTYEEGNVMVEGGAVGVSKRKFDEMYAELEEQRELATNRLTELEKLQKDHQEALREVERLKMDVASIDVGAAVDGSSRRKLSTLPEHVIVETVEYKCLQSQFSVLYNESMQMKTQLEDARSMLQTSKNTHLRQVEQMESDELSCQKKLRTEMIQLEDQLAQVRREYDMLRIEFEQTLAANEQTGPINREMRNLITSLKNHNEQLKGEVSRYKRKLRESQVEINKKLRASPCDMCSYRVGLSPLVPESPHYTGTARVPSTPSAPAQSLGASPKHTNWNSPLTVIISPMTPGVGQLASPAHPNLVSPVASDTTPSENGTVALSKWLAENKKDIALVSGPVDIPLEAGEMEGLSAPVDPRGPLYRPGGRDHSSARLNINATRDPRVRRCSTSSTDRTPNSETEGFHLIPCDLPVVVSMMKEHSEEKLQGSSSKQTKHQSLSNNNKQYDGTAARTRPMPSRELFKEPKGSPSGRIVSAAAGDHGTLGADMAGARSLSDDLGIIPQLETAANTPSQLKTEQQAVEAKATPGGSCPEKEEPVAARLEEPLVLRKEEEDKEEKEREKGKSDAEIIKDLKTQLKKSQDSQKEMKLLLDMYKSVTKESRDKVQLMAAEKKARQEIEELKGHIRRMAEAEKRERRKLAEEDAIRKIKKHEETIAELQKNLAAQKQEEEALLNEMEVTGQAFEDMQEQNIRLLQQLREKDDANFKLMSERIKSSQIHKLLREEKDILAEQVVTLQSQVEAQNLVVRKLEDKERILQNNLATIEKELNLRQQAMELHKRKAIETAQTAADLKLHLDKYHAQLKEAQSAVADKTSALQHETFKHKRIHEEVASLRRKVERAKKIEMASSADEVLMEEIREYKEQLTCPSCKVKKKDAVLTKCFHVFCLECLKTRYETRQRKCPKCNAAFGANDYHRLYLT